MLQPKGGWMKMQLTVMQTQVRKLSCTILCMHAGIHTQCLKVHVALDLLLIAE